MSKFNYDIGMVHPDEYNCEEQFIEATDTLEPFVTVDRGKLRGLLKEYLELKWMREGLEK